MDKVSRNKEEVVVTEAQKEAIKKILDMLKSK